MAMYLIRVIDAVRCGLLIIVQCIGGIVASYIVKALVPGGFNVNTTLKKGISTGQGFVIEMLLTWQLVFTIIMLAGERHEATYLAPVGIGLSLFVGELFGKRLALDNMPLTRLQACFGQVVRSIHPEVLDLQSPRASSPHLFGYTGSRPW